MFLSADIAERQLAQTGTRNRRDFPPHTVARGTQPILLGPAGRRIIARRTVATIRLALQIPDTLTISPGLVMSMKIMRN